MLHHIQKSYRIKSLLLSAHAATALLVCGRGRGAGLMTTIVIIMIPKREVRGIEQRKEWEEVGYWGVYNVEDT